MENEEKIHEKQFTDEDIQIENRYTKRFSILLATREIQIKATMRYNYTPIRMSKIKNADNTVLGSIVTSENSCLSGTLKC